MEKERVDKLVGIVRRSLGDRGTGITVRDDHFYIKSSSMRESIKVDLRDNTIISHHQYSCLTSVIVDNFRRYGNESFNLKYNN